MVRVWNIYNILYDRVTYKGAQGSHVRRLFLCKGKKQLSKIFNFYYVTLQRFPFFVFQYWFTSYDLSILCPFDLTLLMLWFASLNYCDWTFILGLNGNLVFFSIFLRIYPFTKFVLFLNSISVSSILI